eukprot:MONOS_11487.1-p1 / transcript=MONOS_11487.1 / gene=MONOS_11487 / organism=Monocercomonoides_exilis_PA203 / gene_product=unspecified product / transcript_product=unspecified product / location=Mono_scaffold00579:28287-30665(+) / protein_length=793 / sequence_SO=supercontig / SO=protein_coding / is_pseudo=false
MIDARNTHLLSIKASTQDYYSGYSISRADASSEMKTCENQACSTDVSSVPFGVLASYATSSTSPEKLLDKLNANAKSFPLKAEFLNAPHNCLADPPNYSAFRSNLHKKIKPLPASHLDIITSESFAAELQKEYEKEQTTDAQAKTSIVKSEKMEIESGADDIGDAESDDEGNLVLSEKWQRPQANYMDDIDVDVDGHRKSTIEKVCRTKLLSKWQQEDITSKSKFDDKQQTITDGELKDDGQSNEGNHLVSKSKQGSSSMRPHRRSLIKKQLKEAKQHMKMFNVWVDKNWIDNEEEKALWDDAKTKMQSKMEKQSDGLDGRSRREEALNASIKTETEKAKMTLEEMKYILDQADERGLGEAEKNELIENIKRKQIKLETAEERNQASDLDRFILFHKKEFEKSKRQYETQIPKENLNNSSDSDFTNKLVQAPNSENSQTLDSSILLRLCKSALSYNENATTPDSKKFVLKPPLLSIPDESPKAKNSPFPSPKESVGSVASVSSETILTSPSRRNSNLTPKLQRESESLSSFGKSASHHSLSSLSQSSTHMDHHSSHQAHQMHSSRSSRIHTPTKSYSSNASWNGVHPAQSFRDLSASPRVSSGFSVTDSPTHMRHDDSNSSIFGETLTCYSFDKPSDVDLLFQGFWMDALHEEFVDCCSTILNASASSEDFNCRWATLDQIEMLPRYKDKQLKKEWEKKKTDNSKNKTDSIFSEDIKVIIPVFYYILRGGLIHNWKYSPRYTMKKTIFREINRTYRGKCYQHYFKLRSEMLVDQWKLHKISKNEYKYLSGKW